MPFDPKIVWNEYQRGLMYTRKTGLRENWPLFERMKQGRQWAQPTERTRNLPRPVFNIIESFIRLKTAELSRKGCYLKYSGGEFADNMTYRADLIWNDTDQDELCEDFLDDAATYGTSIIHYYLNPATGRIRGELLSPLSVFFSDPTVREVQSQRSIVVSTETPTEIVREQAMRTGRPVAEIDRIVSEQNAAGQVVTQVLTRYFRKDGKVVFVKTAGECLLVDTTPLGEGITLYPMEVFCWRKRRDSIFGTGEVEGIIPNQRAINFVVAMLLLSVQQTAWPKLLVKEGALRHPPTNSPGEILTDYSTDGQGIRYLEPPVYPAQALAVADKVFELSRIASGVSEVMSGEPFSKNASAQAISALQMQAKVPLEAVHMRYLRSLSNIGRIWAQLCGLYSDKMICNAEIKESSI